MATEARDIETRLLNLMRDPVLARQYAPGIRARLLSAEGQAILKSLLYAIQKGATKTLSIQDLWLCVKTQYPGHDLGPIRDVLHEMKGHAGDERQPGLIKALYDENATRLLVREVSSLLAAQLESGKYDVEAARKMLTVDAIGEVFTPEPVDFVKASKSGILPPRIPVGLPGVDEQFGGGYSERELGLVVGPPKRGKSALLVNIGGHELERCRSVLYVSLADLFYENIVSRFSSWLTKRPIEYLIEHPRAMRTLQGWFEQKGHKLYAVDWTTRTTTLADLDRVIGETKGAEPKLRLVLVDRAETIAVPNKYGILRHELKEIYTELRRIAGRHGVAMWADSQADSRAYTSKKVGMDKGSEDKIGKAGVTDLWMGITREADDHSSYWLTLDGRRKITQEMFHLRMDQDTFRMKEEVSYEGEGDSEQTDRAGRRSG